MASYDLSGRRILVVDGDEAFGAWAEDVLRGAKAADVRRARTGHDASAAIADFAADLVILELPAEAKATVGFMGQLRKAGSPGIRALVVPMAESAKPETLRQVCLLGINSFVRKPVDADDLLKRVNGALRNPVRFVFARRYFGPDRRKRELAHEGPERRRSA